MPANLAGMGSRLYKHAQLQNQMIRHLGFVKRTVVTPALLCNRMMINTSPARKCWASPRQDVQVIPTRKGRGVQGLQT